MPDARPLDHDVVLLHLSVVGKPAHRIDGFVSQVVSVKNKINIVSNTTEQF